MQLLEAPAAGATAVPLTVVAYASTDERIPGRSLAAPRERGHDAGGASLSALRRGEQEERAGLAKEQAWQFFVDEAMSSKT